MGDALTRRRGLALLARERASIHRGDWSRIGGPRLARELRQIASMLDRGPVGTTPESAASIRAAVLEAARRISPEAPATTDGHSDPAP